MNNIGHIGLSSEQAVKSRSKHGSNELKSKKNKSFFKKLISNFGDPIIRILLGALVLNVVFSLGSMDIAETSGIIIAVLTSTLVSTISEYGSEKAFEKLKMQSSLQKCRVIRDGVSEEIPINNIVVGDAVILSAGESIPADGYIISGNVKVDQSAINGESREVKKAPSSSRVMSPDKDNTLLRGSMLTSGGCIMLVDAVGENTNIGRIATDLGADTRESPLKLRLSKLARIISYIGYVMAALVAIVYIYNALVIDSGFDKQLFLTKLTNVKYIAGIIVNALSIGVTILVVAVPEGLPMMICVVLSANMKRMLKDKILVKKPVGIETAGNMNILFCDKTGTLTNGVQSVEIITDGKGNTIKLNERKKYGEIYKAFQDNAQYNSECSYKKGKPEGSNATDRAISLYFGIKESKQSIIKTRIPFDSRYKFSAVMLADKRVLIKGAPEVIVSSSDFCLLQNGEKARLDREKVGLKMREMTQAAMRVIAVGIADKMPVNGKPSCITFVGLIGIRDMIRDSAKPSVEKLNGAGVKVVMLTGDHKETALAVAKEIGIVKNDDDIMLTSDELAHMSDDEASEILPKVAVLSRALPQDKIRLVRLAQTNGLVVGMTGDGVNDSPALKGADIGFAMGNGTDVAKEAGDIVILNNDIKSIVKSVLYGRTIFKSIQKFIVFQLTMNLCATLVTLIGPFIGIDSPITIVQMLWVNMIMDTLGGLAFAGEAASEKTLKEKPKSSKDSLLDAPMAAKILWLGFCTLSICIAFMAIDGVKSYFGYYDDSIYYYAAFFCLFIFLGVINCFNARTERLDLFADLSKNKAFMIIMTGVTLVQLIMVYFGGATFRAAPLSVQRLMIVLLMSFTVIPLDFIRKIICRLKKGIVN